MPVTIGTQPSQRLSVVIADDSPAMREGLGRLIAHECDLAVADSAATAAELRTIVARQAPGLLLMDLMLHDEDGLALIQDLLQLSPQLRIVVFTLQPAEVYAVRCLRAGARAYVGKREPVNTLFQAIREVAAGGLVVPAGVSSGMLNGPADQGRVAPGVAAALSNRELQVFRLVGLAQPTRMIAAKLGVSVKTVETHRENIKNKLNLNSHAELIACATRWLRENNGT